MQVRFMIMGDDRRMSVNARLHHAAMVTGGAFCVLATAQMHDQSGDLRAETAQRFTCHGLDMTGQGFVALDALVGICLDFHAGVLPVKVLF